MSDAKDYITKNEIPQLFECLMTGLMYHRPSDHISYLQECLEKIKNQGIQGVRWDLFLESKRAKTPLPSIPKHTQLPVSRENSTVSLEESGKVKLPPISSEKQTKHTPVTSNIPELRIPFDVPIIVVIGGPGSGKKDVCAAMADRYGFRYMSIGKLLKDKIMANKDMKSKWKLVDELVQKGELAADETTISVLIKSLNSFQNAKGFIIEGFPRTLDQVEQWKKHISRVDHLYLIDCEQDYLQERLLRRYHEHRMVEDQPGNIAKRINFFKNFTLPVCRYYDDQHKLVVQPIEIETSNDQICSHVFGHFDQYFSAIIGNSDSNSVRKEKIDSSNVPVENKDNIDNQIKDTAYGQVNESHTDDPTELISRQPTVTYIRKLDDIVVNNKRNESLPSCPIILLLGGPGSGRSVQAKNIASRYNGFTHISISDIVRDQTLNEGADEAWMALTQLAKKGELEEKIDISVVKKALIERGKDANCILLEGFPNNEKQLQDFYDVVGTADLSILFDCEEYYMTNRLLERGKEQGRLDDNLSAIACRILQFKEMTLPVVRHFDEIGKLCIILGDRDSDEVFFDVASLIDYCFFNQISSIEQDEGEAAARIQAAFRGYITRKEYINAHSQKTGDANQEPSLESSVKIMDDDATAATTIQAGFRGYQTRKSMKATDESNKSDSVNNNEQDAAIKIQAGFRGYQTRKNFNRE